MRKVADFIKSSDRKTNKQTIKKTNKQKNKKIKKQKQRQNKNKNKTKQKSFAADAQKLNVGSIWTPLTRGKNKPKLSRAIWALNVICLRALTIF